MFKINTTIQGLDKLQKEINRLEKLIKTENNINLLNQKLAIKMLEIVNEVANNRIMLLSSTNEEEKSKYLNNNKYRIEGNTIVLYNDLCILSPKSKVSGSYLFCVALAFEYGTGVIGKQNPKLGAWQYDINSEKNRAIVDDEKLDGWWIPIEKVGKVEPLATSKSGKSVVVQGYEGVEIYRFAREEIIKRLPTIMNEILNGNEV